MRITKIERQKKHPTRKSVFIDGIFAFGITDEVLLRAGLHEGGELNSADIDDILGRENEESAKQKALRYLAIRPRSEKEIRDYLLRKEFSGDIVERVLVKLASLKLIDDADFARMICRDALALKPAGERLLRQILFKKGVQKATVDAVIPEFYTPESELAMAVRAAERHHRKTGRAVRVADDRTAKKKLLEYLVRRGFRFETALDAANHILSK